MFLPVKMLQPGDIVDDKKVVSKTYKGVWMAGVYSVVVVFDDATIYELPPDYEVYVDELCLCLMDSNFS